MNGKENCSKNLFFVIVHRLAGSSVNSLWLLGCPVRPLHSLATLYSCHVFDIVSWDASVFLPRRSLFAIGFVEYLSRTVSKDGDATSHLYPTVT